MKLWGQRRLNVFVAHKRFMHSNITSSYAYGIIKKNGFLTGEHGAGNLTVLVLILVLCLNRKTKKLSFAFWTNSGIQFLLHPYYSYYSNTICMEYSFFHKNDFFFGANCIRLSGVLWVKGKSKVSGEMLVFPNPLLHRRQRSPSHKVSKISAGDASGNHSWYQFLMPEASGCPLTQSAGPGVNTCFFWGGGFLLGVRPVVLSGFLSRLIRLEDC